MNGSTPPRPRRGLALVFTGAATVLAGVNAHFLTDAAAWRLLILVGGVVQVAGWLLFNRDRRQS